MHAGSVKVTASCEPGQTGICHDGDECASFGRLVATRGHREAEPPQVGVGAEWPEDVLCALHQ